MANVETKNAGNNNVPAITNQKQQPVKNNQLTVSHLKTLKPFEVADDPLVGNKFVDIFMKVHGVNAKEASLVLESEKFYYKKQIQENAALQNCTQLSLYGAFLDVAVNHLSFD